MSLTFGFYDSLPNDIREYHSTEISSLFDGLIYDGILMNIGDRFMVKENNGMFITIGSGRAWFNHAWTLNDSDMILKVSDSSMIFPRIDAVVLEIDSRITRRIHTIKIVNGTPETEPKNPILTNTEEVHQYPLAYIFVEHGVTEIHQADITNAVGTSECPFVTGVVQVMNIDDLVSQWKDQWKQFYNIQTKEITASNTNWNNQWDTFFETIKGKLGDDPATQLAGEIVEIQNQVGNLKFIKCTKAEYDSLGPGRDPNTIYIYPKDGGEINE